METFIVRIWVPADGNGGQSGQAASLRGFVEHVGSGESSPFRGADELVELVQARSVADRVRGEQAINRRR